MAELAKSRPSESQIRRAQRRVEALLEVDGLLVCQDAELPSATTCIAGTPVRGSWWGHPEGHLIYEVLGRIEPGVACAKLVLGKETFVHRRLWPSLVAAARCGQTWQLGALAADAAHLLKTVRRSAAVRTDELKLPAGSRKVGALATELERRLLVHARSEHTTSGHHARVLETWDAWAERARISPSALPAVDDALEALTAPLRRHVHHSELAGFLPWFPKAARRRRDNG